MLGGKANKDLTRGINFVLIREKYFISDFLQRRITNLLKTQMGTILLRIAPIHLRLPRLPLVPDYGYCDRHFVLHLIRIVSTFRYVMPVSPKQEPACFQYLVCVFPIAQDHASFKTTLLPSTFRLAFYHSTFQLSLRYSRLPSRTKCHSVIMGFPGGIPFSHQIPGGFPAGDVQFYS